MKKTNTYLLILLAYLIVGAVLYYIVPGFVNSSFFFASVTFVVGSLAFYIYTQQKADEKTNAAITVLTEIRNAENKVDIIINELNANNTSDLPSVLPTNSWRKYSHLFVKDLDSDELQLMNSFYTSCEVIEDFVNRQNNFFWVTTEERAKTAQRVLAQIHDDFQIEAREEGDVHPIAQKKFDDRKAGLTQFYSNETYTYAPQKTLTVLKFQTQNFQKITPTVCGAKFKRIANL
ncbi:MAG TPA: hypothetical protein VNF51_00890 [Candidatus Paceibacterota bacterium]|nr:hypothetical protein [Candidatus Paceibacterota bacterium]